MIGTGRLNRAARIRDRICVLSPISASPTTSVDTRKASMSEPGRPKSGRYPAANARIRFPVASTIALWPGWISVVALISSITAGPTIRRPLVSAARS